MYGEGEYRRMSIVVGYEVYLKRAERTGKLDGWSTRIEGEGENMKAIVEIHQEGLGGTLRPRGLLARGRPEEEGWHPDRILDQAAALPAQEGRYQPGLPSVLPR